MSDKARRRFIEAYERRMSELFTHPTLNQRLPIRQCLLAQARQVAEAAQSGRPEFRPMGFR
jgi:CRISPR/Cas system-associated endonuclease Cas1